MQSDSVGRFLIRDVRGDFYLLVASVPLIAQVLWTRKAPAARPIARANHVMAYDSGRGRVVLFGGSIRSPGGPPANDTWEWNGAS